MRERLTWKQAEQMKKADPYTMNQDHTNNPVEKYKTGEPSTWAEDPDLRKPWEQEGRTETGHPAPEPSAAPAPAPVAPAPTMASAKEAVANAKLMQDKALKCITIAQRMLPGAADDLVEAQATDLMFMPERCVLATLQRQGWLAEKLASECGEKDEDEEKAKVEAAEKAEAPKDDAAKVTEEKEVEAAKKDDAAPAETPAEIPAEAPASSTPAPKKKEETPAGTPAETDKKAAGDLLDLIFDDMPKTGAKTLSGIVKQASTGVELSDLWDSAPDISKAFK